MTSALEVVVRTLREQGTPFALIGAGAMAIHGVSRATQDIDLLATSARCLEPAFWKPVVQAGVSVDVRIGDADDPLLGVARFRGPQPSPIDLVVGRGAWQREMLDRAESVEVASVTLPVVTASDLILLKLYAGGIQDRWDIVQLLETAPADARGQVDRRIGALPDASARLWSELCAQV